MATLLVSGKPAIADPQVLDLPTLRQRVANIRERFRLLEIAVNRLSGLADGSQTSSEIALLQRQVHQLAQQIAVLNAAAGSSDLTASDVLQTQSMMPPAADPHLIDASDIVQVQTMLPRDEAPPARPDDAQFIIANQSFGG